MAINRIFSPLDTPCLAIKKKLQGILKDKKKKKIQFEETKQARVRHRRILELSDREFKTTLVYMLRTVVDEVAACES